MWKKLSTGGEDDSRVVENFDPLGAELFQGDTLDPDEGFVGYFHLVFLGEFVERRFLDDRGPRLRNQYSLYFQDADNLGY